MAEKIDRGTRSYIMSKIKKTNTKPEIIVRSFLFKKGLRFRIHANKMPGNPDILLPKYRTVLFINGCFWHCHPGCKYNKPPKSRQEYWIPKLKRNVERDLNNKMELKKLGWKVIVVWECDLKKIKQEKTLEKLYRAIIKNEIL